MAFESIHNYYEQLVLDQLLKLTDSELRDESDESDESDDFLSDIACVALNQLPPRYVRHNVDTAFYMTQEEREAIDQEVDKAVKKAIDYVNKHRDDHQPQ
ncbi:late competence development ComFB family protein [Thiohalophilus sp.]|uniref:late competence development ComFB family protein n=1 Tax=Thiohalophilus sp. TaxID=3028392 RepID=UPI002ACDB557|nr:late competence development ComFB family protein [Thiohalophilus sp.]MDZ7803878.1 late competence development ComFB family protein [Thiohalophilus sp.]